MKKSFVALFFALVLILPAPAFAAQLTGQQIQAILGLLAAFNVPAETINTISQILYSPASTSTSAVRDIKLPATVVLSVGESITTTRSICGWKTVETLTLVDVGSTWATLKSSSADSNLTKTVNVLTNSYRTHYSSSTVLSVTSGSAQLSIREILYFYEC